MARDVMHSELIAVVEQQPVIWDVECPGYSDRVLRKKVWMDVCKDLTPNWEYLSDRAKESRERELSVRWRSLRDRYVKEVREERDGLRSGITGKRKRPFLYMEDMAFLRRNLELRATTSTVSSPQNMDELSQLGPELEEQYDGHECEVPMFDEATPEGDQHYLPGPSTQSLSPAPPRPSRRARRRAQQNTTAIDLDSRLVTLLEQIRDRQLTLQAPADPEDVSAARDADVSFVQAVLPMLRELKPEWRVEARGHIYMFLTKCLSAQSRGQPFPTVLIHDTPPPSCPSATRSSLATDGPALTKQEGDGPRQVSQPGSSSVQSNYQYQ